METTAQKREIKSYTIYSRNLLTRSILLPINAVGKNIRETIERNIAVQFEGKCVVEGFIKSGSSKIITYSSGLIIRGNQISFEVVFECDVCFPVEGMLITCLAKNITKAGIRAESAYDSPSPIVVFVARDHHYNDAFFSDIKEGDKIDIRVIGQRFELNDKYISIIAELLKPGSNPNINPNKNINPTIMNPTNNNLGIKKTNANLKEQGKKPRIKIVG
jgi:DNA-directed RNA polymerase subunit E'/Rpb7